MQTSKRAPATEPIIVNESEILASMADLADRHGVDRNTVYYWKTGRTKNRLTLAKKYGVITVRFVKDVHLAAEYAKIVAGVQAELAALKAKETKKDRSIRFWQGSEDSEPIVCKNRAKGAEHWGISREAMRQWEIFGIPAKYNIVKVDWNR